MAVRHRLHSWNFSTSQALVQGLGRGRPGLHGHAWLHRICRRTRACMTRELCGVVRLRGQRASKLSVDFRSSGSAPEVITLKAGEAEPPRIRRTDTEWFGAECADSTNYSGSVPYPWLSMTSEGAYKHLTRSDAISLSSSEPIQCTSLSSDSPSRSGGWSEQCPHRPKGNPGHDRRTLRRASELSFHRPVRRAVGLRKEHHLRREHPPVRG